MSKDNEDNILSHVTSPTELSYTESGETETESETVTETVTESETETQTESESLTDSQTSAIKSSNSKIEETYKVPVTKAVNFPEYVREKFAQNLKPDILICIGDQFIECQRSVLELYSDYIRLLKSRKKYLTFPSEKVTPDAMKCIYDWMCSRHYNLKRDTVLEVHAAAKFLEIDYLIEQTWNCITSPIISEDRAFMLYLEAIFFELPAVQRAMITRVQKFFLTLVGFAQFVELPFGHVCEMLASDNLGVNSELEVFFACVRYLNSHWEDRKERVFEMLRNVRFGLLPPHILVSFRFKKEAPEINRMLENVRVEKLLSQTMHFSIGLGTPPKSSLLFKERKWIYDLDCDYHSTKSLPGRKRLTYEKFLEYIRFLAESETHWLNFENLHDVEKAAQLMKVCEESKPGTT